MTEEPLAHFAVEHAAFGVVVVDRARIIRFINAAAQRLLGPSTILVGRPFPYPVNGSATPEPRCVEAEDRSWSAEMRIARAERQGEPFYVVSLVETTDLHHLLSCMQEMRFMDELTGLLSRRGFLTLIHQQLKIAQRSGKSLLLLLMDIDNLRQINQRHGRVIGDAAILEAATLIKECFRGSDIVARVGGDEFAVAALDADEASGERLLHRLRERFAARDARPDARFPLRLSVGLFRYALDPASSVEELLSRLEVPGGPS